ncbi:MAG: imidazolonepropionase [Actinobacteria bacterium]|nr:imidazolonepropionase [Actinomycetota bacterium]
MAPDAGVPYGLIDDGVVAIADGWIVHVGPRGSEDGLEVARTGSAHGRLVTPGLVDCHTHLVFGGHRAGELEQRLGGATYEDIARAGGGIASTVAATRAADDDELLASARRRLGWLADGGVTTVEVKSGYGLDLDTELRMLRVARRLGEDGTTRVTTTFLAHTVPADRRDDPDGYVEEVCREMLPAVVAERLADAVDVFCETIAFSPAQTERILSAAVDLGLPVKVHAEQLSDQNGAALAARYGALSADHLEHLPPEGAVALAEAGTVAVLLPGASVFLDEDRRPPVDLLRQHRVPIAVSTDLNPGTSPLGSLLQAVNLACTRFRLTPEEALRGATEHAARALGLDDRGVVAPGKLADLALWEVEHPAELAYWHGADLLAARLLGGELTVPGEPGSREHA